MPIIVGSNFRTETEIELSVDIFGACEREYAPQCEPNNASEAGPLPINDSHDLWPRQEGKGKQAPFSNLVEEKRR